MKEFDPGYATAVVVVGKTTYTVREVSLEEFERCNDIRKSDVANAGIAATLDMVSSGLLDPKLDPAQFKKLGLGTLMKLGSAILSVSGVGKDEKKDESADA